MKTIPVQERSAQRVADILKVAENLILEMSIEDITPTIIAKRADMTRTSLYHFFPSKFDIFDALAAKYHDDIQAEVIRFFHTADRHDYRQAWSGIAGVYSGYFNRNPAAAILLLGRKGKKQIALTDLDGDTRLASNIMGLMTAHTNLPTGGRHKAPGLDLFQIIVELMRATFSLGMRKDGRISRQICQEAEQASIAYLETRLRS